MHNGTKFLQNEGRSEAYAGRSEAHEGRSEAYEGRSEAHGGHSESHEGRSAAREGRSDAHEGRSETHEGSNYLPNSLQMGLAVRTNNVLLGAWTAIGHISPNMCESGPRDCQTGQHTKQITKPY